MTIDEFLTKLTSSTKKFKERPGGVVASAGIMRFYAESTVAYYAYYYCPITYCPICPITYCPITLVAQEETGEFYNVSQHALAGRELKLGYADQRLLVAAADNHHDLTAPGLENDRVDDMRTRLRHAIEAGLTP